MALLDLLPQKVQPGEKKIDVARSYLWIPALPFVPAVTTAARSH